MEASYLQVRESMGQLAEAHSKVSTECVAVKGQLEALEQEKCIS